MLAHRKQGPVLPTLVITISDRERKRRSSRAAGLISTNKESGATTLWFRTPPDDHHPSLHEWARCILSKKSPTRADSIVSPAFSSPFSPRTRDTPDYFPRPESSSRPDGRSLQHKSSTATYSTDPRDRPATFSSDSPSLKSKRSDISSPSSLNQYTSPNMAFSFPGQHYTTVLPTDLGSPASLIADYRGEFIEGWTSAQGRSSIMSSPSRGRDSMSPHVHTPALKDISAPPAPGETILDRAFLLGHIPGADYNIPGQEKFSSVARFDALMRDADEKRKRREAFERAEQLAMQSALEADDSSDKTESQSSDEDTDSDDDEPAHEDEHDSSNEKGPLISPSAQRALAFIAGRHEDEPTRDRSAHRPSISRAHLSFHADSVKIVPQSPPERPHTSHAKSRPTPSQRNQSTPQLVPASTRQLVEDGARRTNAEKRLSSSSVKRLSFNDITKRLSSSSSLLLVQTNASGGSSRASSEIDILPSATPRTNLSLRGIAPPPKRRGWEEQDRKCGWRGSVSIVGTDGGFL